MDHVCSVIMLSHSVNLTLPWTLGVFMVRDFMHLSGESASEQLSGSGETSALARLRSPTSLPTAVPADDLNLPDGNNSSNGRVHQDLSLEQAEEAEKQEQLVGYRAGILSAAFSLAQVCT